MAASDVSAGEFLEKRSSTRKIAEVPHTSKDDDGENNVEIDLSIKCRACLVEESEMHYLFTVFDQELSLADILIQTTLYECREDDGLPPYLCTSCTTCLIDFFNFKVQFQETDIYLKSVMNQAAKVSTSKKVSDDDDDDDADDSSNDVTESIPETPGKFMPNIDELSEGPKDRCEECNENFSTDSEHQTHMAMHHGINPLNKYSLFRCLIEEHSKAAAAAKKRTKYLAEDLKEEMLLKQPGRLCRFCRLKFPEDEFKAHWEQHKIHICEHCGHKCVKKSDLQVHMMSVHNTARNFKCGLCGKSFKTKPQLKRHEIIHYNPRSYCCEICGGRFNDNSTLKTHVQLKHVGSRDFICPICGLAFPMKSTLDKHIIRHDKQRRPSFFCKICTGAFRDKSSLQRHKLVKHSGNFIRPTCEYCGKSYCSTTKVKHHIMRHHPNEQNAQTDQEPDQNQITITTMKKSFKEEVSDSGSGDYQEVYGKGFKMEYESGSEFNDSE